ncbi:MAG: hypothetical protein VYA69_11730, partial [Gemmatimonadota bacterium]|nr:hypothetical protein [Gemmatimonadota bacterium]
LSEVRREHLEMKELEHAVGDHGDPQGISYDDPKPIMEFGVVLPPPVGDAPDQRDDHGKYHTTTHLYPVAETITIRGYWWGRDEQEVTGYPRH